jgi:hypothetical protein
MADGGAAGGGGPAGSEEGSGAVGTEGAWAGALLSGAGLSITTRGGSAGCMVVAPLMADRDGGRQWHGTLVLLDRSMPVDCCRRGVYRAQRKPIP